MLGGLGGKANGGIYTKVIPEIEWHEIRCANGGSNNGAGTATGQELE